MARSAGAHAAKDTWLQCCWGEKPLLIVAHRCSYDAPIVPRIEQDRIDRYF